MYTINQLEELALRIVRRSPIAVLVVDMEGEIKFVNDRLTILFGYDALELLGESMDILVPEGQRAAHALDLEEYVKEPQDRPLGLHKDIKGRHKDGHEIDVDISLASFTTRTGVMTVAYIIKK